MSGNGEGGGMNQLAADLAAFRARSAELFEQLVGSGNDTQTVVWHLIRVATLVERSLETEVYRPLGLTWTGFRIMYNVYVLGSVEPYRLAHIIGVSAPSISSGLTTLERLGLVSRSRELPNRRVVRVALTPKGKQTVESTLPRHYAAEVAALQALEPAEMAQLAQLLSKVFRAHQQLPQ